LKASPSSKFYVLSTQFVNFLSTPHRRPTMKGRFFFAITLSRERSNGMSTRDSTSSRTGTRPMTSRLAQQRYAKSHRILANCRGVKDFRRFRNCQDGTWFSESVLGLDSNRILKRVLREIILSQETQMPQAAADPWAMACSNSSSLGRVIDLGEFLRQVEVIPADDAIES
jgi:hypothetical protein